MTNEQILKPRKALNPAYLKVKPNRIDIERFKIQLIALLDQSNDKESEEFHKNLISDFLKKTWYDPSHFINTKGRNDLVIHNGNKAGIEVGVIIEAKKPTNKAEMPSKGNLNSKAFQELVLYYLRERIIEKNTSVRHLIVTNIYEWFIVDAIHFDRLFAQNKKIVKDFEEFTAGSKADTKTDFFYKSIAEPEFEKVKHQIPFTYFDFRDYEKPLRNTDKEDDAKLIALFKLLSPEHLLKLPFANDSNSLDKRFYTELLHLIGLEEKKDGGKKVIKRPDKEDRHPGSLLENAINQLQSLDKLSRLDRPSQYGATEEERLFAVGLELCITWVNRILFLKLLEAQLLSYNKGNKVYNFLSTDKISDFDELNSLFFEVLARKIEDRIDEVKTKFAHVPYLNSSLFEPTDMEHNTLLIANLKNERKLKILQTSVLKDSNGKKLSGELNALEYFFRFLDSYDFSSEGSEEIQEENKTLINASVLGLIFEKINGYKDGSFFTPGFITMYMCRETIRRAVVQKFNEAINTLTTNPSPLRRGEQPKIELQGQKINPELLDHAREMRKNQTPAEEFLWNLLRNRRFLGYKFRRQHPIGQKFILDFFCDELRLGIELDGDYHNSQDQKEYDEGRTYELSELDIKIIRFNNEEVLWETEKILEAIRCFSESQSPLSSGRGVGGEGFKVGSGIIDFEDLYDLIGHGGKFSYSEANTLINSLKICDPAVGSGHFLVSALNEIIAVKNDLRVLQDRSGKRLKEYGVSVVNDELVVTDEDGELYEYNPNNPESQRIQETLFHEKQTIIENCLFGVDINPNSVKICRLRLWIELLKSAYYKTPLSLGRGAGGEGALRELETLPNIDINIKCGNSLVSRFALDADLSQALKKSKFSIDAYRIAVDTYRNARNKEEKREMERLIEAIKSDFRSEITKNDPKITRKAKLAGELYNLTMQTGLFEESATEKKKRQVRIEKIEDELNKLETEIEEIKANKIFENAFEWRFEFPEVLNQEGDFVGFDVVIGNPPYIRQEEFSDLKPYLQSRFQTFAGTADLYVYFVELSMNLVKDSGNFVFIIPNKWMRAGYGKALRKYVKGFLIHELLDFGDLQVFEEATTYPLIIALSKNLSSKNFKAVNLQTLDFPSGMENYLIENQLEVSPFGLSDEGWTLTDSRSQALLLKLKSKGVPLTEYVDGKIFYGIKTGYNEAFVIDKATKERLVAEDPRSAEVIKPFLAGRDIKRYQQPKSDKFLILFPKGFTIKSNLPDHDPNKINQVSEPPRYGYMEYDPAWEWITNNFPAIANHLKPFERAAKKRTDQGDFWWELRACDYYEEFEMEKIMLPDISIKAEALIDTNKMYCVNTAYIIPKAEKYLLAIINSTLVHFFYSNLTSTIRGGYLRFIRQYLAQIPIIEPSNQLRESIELLVNQIIDMKSVNNLDISIELENQIDQLVYELYGLTEEEIRIVEGN
jgi:very-short-patch-repair endonuclease